MKRLSLLISAVYTVALSYTLLLSAPVRAQHLIGAGGLQLNDGLGHTVLITLPATLTGPSSTWTLPITPAGNGTAYVEPGTVDGQMLLWNNTTGQWTASSPITSSVVNGTTTGQMLLWNSGTNRWEPGTYVPVPSGVTTGDLLQWDGAAWQSQPLTLPSSVVTLNPVATQTGTVKVSQLEVGTGSPLTVNSSGALTTSGSLTTTAASASRTLAVGSASQLTVNASGDLNTSGSITTTGSLGGATLAIDGGMSVGPTGNISTTGTLAVGSSSQFTVSASGNVATSGTLSVGSGTALTSILTATASLDFPSVNGGNSDLTISVPGAAVGDAVALGTPDYTAAAHICYTAWVSTSGTVTVRYNNYGNTYNPPAGTFRVTVFHY